MTFGLVLSLVGWLAGWWLWGRPETVDGAVGDARASHADSASRPGRRIIAVVPARNEAAVVSGLLEDLLVQTVDVQVVVVDDHSTDGTASVARRVAAEAPERLKVELAPPLPGGWVGKNWACHHGAQVALGAGASDDDLFVFLDADVRLAPGAIERAVSLVRPGLVVSVQPFHTARRLYEKLSLFCGLVALGAIGAGRRGHLPSGLCGPLIAMTVADHQRVGGHASVQGELVEDLALGARLVEIGICTRVLLGGRSVSYRMYPAGLGQLVEGWTKNLAAGAGAVPWWRTALSAVWITALGDAALDLGGATRPGGPAGAGLLLPLAVYGAFASQVAVLGRRSGTFGAVTALWYPIPLAAFVVLFLRSLWRRTVRRRVEWRGRSVPTGRVRTPT